MKDVVYICLVISAISSVFRIIISALSKENVAKAFQTIIDILLLLNILVAVCGVKLPEMPDFDAAETIDFELEADMLSAVIEEAEKQLSKRIMTSVEKHFSVSPCECIVQITDELTLEKLSLYFKSGTLISAYDVKAFLKEEYEIKAEVVFE